MSVNHCRIIKSNFHQQLKALMDKTSQTGLEYAVPICDGGRLGQVAEGNSDSVAVNLQSNENCRMVATFHTHPNNYNAEEHAFFSAADQFVSNQYNHGYHCLGYFLKGKPKIMCGKPLDSNKTRVFMDLENAGRTINEMSKFNVIPSSSYKQFYDVYRELGLSFDESCREDL